jgi:hypothetical protein
MTLTALGWLVTLGVAIHNAEEALSFPAWSTNAGRWHSPVGAGEFRFAVALLTLLLIACAAAASLSAPGSLAAYVFSGFVFAIVANVLAPHVLASLALRRYMPGTGTALLFNLPLGTWFLYRAIREGYVTLSTLVWAAPAVALLLVAAIPLLFAAGRKFVPRLQELSARTPGMIGRKDR